MTHNPWNNAFLNSMRQIGDEEADPIISDLVAKGDIEVANKMMVSLVRNDDIVRDDIPPELHHFLDQTAALPEWVDMALIERGEEFFSINWPIALTILFCASLPRAYATKKGVHVLFITKRLVSHVNRRIFETGQFILDVMAPGGLTGEGRGIRSAQKVRLIHTAVRQFIEYDPQWQARWKPDWDVPINQEDLAGTMLDFSIQILEGMRRFKVPVSPEDAEAFYHCWRVVGHIVGVKDEMMPDTAAGGLELANKIFDRQRGETEEGAELTKALLKFMSDQTPGRLLKDFPATIMRHALDKVVADQLGVPSSNWTVILLKLELLLSRLLSRSGAAQGWGSKVLARFSNDLVLEMVKLERGGKRTRFHIPSSLRDPI